MKFERSIRRWAGLEPRRPERLLVVAAAAAVAAIVLLTAGIFALCGELYWYSPRKDYFLYLLGLAVLAAILAAWPRCAAILLGLALVDFGLGLGSLLLSRTGAGVSVMPDNFYAGGGFQWHPLLQGAPVPSLKGGYDGLTITHSAAGTRGRDYSRDELAGKNVVAAIGGSTTYDLGVTDADTWTTRLEQLLGSDRFAFINHGVLGYTTVEHIIQTAFYMDAFGATPRCAVYYVGWNDLRNSHIDDLDSAYAGYHLRAQIDLLQARRVGTTFVTVSPVFTISARLLAMAIDTARPAPGTPLAMAWAPPRRDGADPKGKVSGAPDPRLEALYARNLTTISAINRGRGIRTIWVPQLINVEKHRTSSEVPWTSLIPPADVWPLLERLNGIMRERAQTLGDTFIDVPITDFTAADFIDHGHFTPAGSAKFAAHVAPEIKRLCAR